MASCDIGCPFPDSALSASYRLAYNSDSSSSGSFSFRSFRELLTRIASLYKRFMSAIRIWSSPSTAYTGRNLEGITGTYFSTRSSGLVPVFFRPCRYRNRRRILFSVSGLVSAFAFCSSSVIVVSMFRFSSSFLKAAPCLCFTWSGGTIHPLSSTPMFPLTSASYSVFVMSSIIRISSSNVGLGISSASAMCPHLEPSRPPITWGSNSPPFSGSKL